MIVYQGLNESIEISENEKEKLGREKFVTLALWSYSNIESGHAAKITSK